MDAAAIEARLTRLEQELAELRLENQSLRARAATTTAAQIREDAPLLRRDLLKGAAYAIGAVGLSLAGTRPVEATEGTMLYGAANNSGSDGTYLTSSTGFQTMAIVNHGLGRALSVSIDSNLTNNSSALYADNTDATSTGHAIHAQASGSGHALFGVKNSNSGHCLLGTHNSTTSLYAAVAGVTKGAGPGCYGRGDGSGNGLWGQIADAAKTQSAVLGTTEGTGPAIEGNSIRGRGGVFKGKKAPIRLMPSNTTTKPATGSRGDLFVDSTGRLWYCKTGGSTTGWKQLA